jgi:hypothetical protein
MPSVISLDVPFYGCGIEQETDRKKQKNLTRNRKVTFLCVSDV